jgi:hypothetical protein
MPGRNICEFIEDVKVSGLVAQAIEKYGVRGVSVASRHQFIELLAHGQKGARLTTSRERFSTTVRDFSGPG